MKVALKLTSILVFAKMAKLKLFTSSCSCAKMGQDGAKMVQDTAKKGQNGLKWDACRILGGPGAEKFVSQGLS